MPKVFKLILRETPIGLPPTPRQSTQREGFAQVANECKEAFKDSKLRGAAKIRAMNQFMSEHLKS